PGGRRGGARKVAHASSLPRVGAAPAYPGGMAWDRAWAAGARVREVPFTGSTNADLAAAVAAGRADHLDVLLTRDQRSGRGRLDRVWQAPPGASLAVSVALRV